MRLAALLLAAATAISCGVAPPALPTFGLPTFDTAQIEQLVDDALGEVGRVASTPIVLPPDLERLLQENNIALPALPSNAEEICAALGTPGVSGLASAGLTALIEQLVVGGEVGLVVGLLVVVVSRSCPIWMPHLEPAIERVL